MILNKQQIFNIIEYQARTEFLSTNMFPTKICQYLSSPLTCSFPSHITSYLGSIPEVNRVNTTPPYWFHASCRYSQTDLVLSVNPSENTDLFSWLPLPTLIPSTRGCTPWRPAADGGYGLTQELEYLDPDFQGQQNHTWCCPSPEVNNSEILLNKWSPAYKISDAGNLNAPKRNYNVLLLSNKAEILKLIRKK